MRWHISKDHNWCNIITTNAQSKLMRRSNGDSFSFIKHLSSHGPEKSIKSTSTPSSRHLPWPHQNQRALVFTLNLNELSLPALWAVCISATGEPMRSELTHYNNLFPSANCTCGRTWRSIAVCTFLSLTTEKDPNRQRVIELYRHLHWISSNR